MLLFLSRKGFETKLILRLFPRTEDILAGVGLSKSDLYRDKQPSTFTHPTIDVVSLAYARRIPWEFLHTLGLADGYNYRGRHVVKIPYHLPDGAEHTKIKVRKGLLGPPEKFTTLSCQSASDVGSLSNTQL